jgi:hypothetical protein
MKQYLLTLSVVLALFSCGSKESVSSKLVDVTYEIESKTTEQFIDVTYEEADAVGNSKQKTDWVIGGMGIFRKTVKIQRGYGAGLSVRNNYSKDFAVRIISSKGEILVFSNEAGFHGGTLSYYGNSVSTTIN